MPIGYERSRLQTIHAKAIAKRRKGELVHAEPAVLPLFGTCVDVTIQKVVNKFLLHVPVFDKSDHFGGFRFRTFRYRIARNIASLPYDLPWYAPAPCGAVPRNMNRIARNIASCPRDLPWYATTPCGAAPRNMNRIA